MKKNNQKTPNYISAAVLINTKKPLVIKKLKLPKIKKGQVLVKIYFTGICKSQIMEIDGKRGKDIWLPHLLGHEAAGKVIKLGKDVSKVKEGDEVVLTWIKGCGCDVPGAAFEYKNKKINSGPITTFSNYTIVSENRVQKKPNNISKLNSTLFGCAIPTGFGMVSNYIKEKKISSIAIIGLGGIGLSAVMASKVFRIKKIVALDISTKKLNIAKKLGAKKTFNTTSKNFNSNFYKYLPNGVDLCIESAGYAKTIELGFSLINRANGKLIFASHPSKNDKIRLDPFELISGKKIEGSWGGAINPDKDFEKISKLLNNKIINNFISKIYSLDKINQAIKDFKTGKVLRPIIKMKHN